MTHDAMGRCGQCGREMTTAGCPACDGVRLYNYPVSDAPPCAKCAQLEAELAEARDEVTRLRGLFVELLEVYMDDVGDTGVKSFWVSALEGDRCFAWTRKGVAEHGQDIGATRRTG